MRVWPRSRAGKILASAYLVVVAAGIATIILADGLEKLWGLVILVYAALSWTLILRHWLLPDDSPIRVFVEVAGLGLNFLAIYAMARWLEDRTTSR